MMENQKDGIIDLTPTPRVMEKRKSQISNLTKMNSQNFKFKVPGTYHRDRCDISLEKNIWPQKIL